MSKLNDLINKLCPDGVEFVKLGETCEVLRGKRLTKKQLSETEKYPVFHGGIQPIGFYSKKNRNANTVMIINVGASAGTIGYSEKDFWSSDGCYCLSHTESVLPRYIYYVLSKDQHYFQSKVRHGGIPTLDALVVRNYRIPLPPLPIQTEIVRILDKFTQLEAELEAELDCRKRQYEFYRDQLLSFDKITPPERNNVVWMPITEVFEMRNGYTPSKNKPEYWEGGKIPWFRMEDIRQNGRILSDSIQHITMDGVKKGNLFKANSFILATTATIGEHALVIADSLANQRFTNLSVRKSLKDRIIIKFLFHYMFIIDDWCKNNVNISGFASVDMNKFKKLEIPIPPIEEQNRIVAILDRFESLTTSLQHGLPAEIAARRQQYECYRDKLLDFKRKTA